MTQELVRATDVFGITRELPMNYVSRPKVDDQLVSALTRDQHLVVYGSSKQGKTSVRKYHLREDEYIVVTCSNRWTLGQLHAAILKQAGYTVVQSETKTAGGNFKIQATAKITGKLFGTGAEAQAGGETGRNHTESLVETRLELDPFDVNEIITALAEISFDKWIVLEDFHYLPEETQKDFAVALKAFHESSELTFVIVGVWLQENRLIQFNGDLSGRVHTINADTWSKAELRQAIETGEDHLNIVFDDAFKDSLLRSCFDSIYVVQESCLAACEAAKILQRTEGPRTNIIMGGNVDQIVRTVVEKQSARFSDFLANFATGFGETELAMYKWLLLPVIMSDLPDLEKGLHYRRIRRILGKYHPRGGGLNAGNITQALKGAASLQVQQGVKPLVLDYDQSLKRLNVVDKSFLIWRRYQESRDLLEMAELPPAILDTWEADLFSPGEDEED